MEFVEKVFTKNRGKDIIQSKYNLLNKNNDFYEREGLFMEVIKDVLSNEKGKIEVDEVVLKCWHNICKYYNKENGIIEK